MRNVPDRPVEPLGLPADEIDGLFSGLTPFSRLALAVSGGADSLTLLILFSEWKRRTHWQGTAEVLCVDHGLRPESASEADFVASVSATHGLPCTILRWEGDKPSGNLQEEARAARYRLIARHMEARGLQALLLAHHLDDQAETFLDRLTRGSGLSGLAAMAQDEFDGPFGLRLLRPFLGVPRARLEASLRARGQSWCEDPSNRDPKYKRSRVRRIMDLLAGEGLTPERIAQTAGHLRHAREALEETALELYGRLVVDHPAGPVKLAREAFRSVAPDLRLRLLCLVIGRVTGRRLHLRFQKLKVLDEALMGGSGSRQTFAGCLFAAGEDTIWAWREPGRVPPDTITVQTDGRVWDNRYRIAAAGVAEDGGVPALLLGPLFQAPLSGKDVAWPDGWPRQAFDCAPVLWTEDGGVVGSSVTAELGLDRFGRRAGFDLVRVPVRAKTDGNPIYEGNREEEI